MDQFSEQELSHLFSETPELTPWRMVLEKLTAIQLVRFSAFYAT
jgi:hypothetical protein